MGELHLEILVDRMKREFKVEANVGAPQVAYREYLAKPVELTYTHKKQSGGSGQFAEIKVSRDPGRARLGLRVHRQRSRAATSPRNISRRSRRACARPPRAGSLIGFPIIDFEVQLTDGKYHDVDSSALAFEICRPRRDARSRAEGRASSCSSRS